MDFHYGSNHDQTVQALWRSIDGEQSSVPMKPVVWTHDSSECPKPWLALLGEYWRSERENGIHDYPVYWQIIKDMCRPETVRMLELSDSAH